jgi:hypothetical protein
MDNNGKRINGKRSDMMLSPVDGDDGGDCDWPHRTTYLRIHRQSHEEMMRRCSVVPH